MSIRQSRLNRKRDNIERTRNIYVDSVKEYLLEVEPESFAARFPSFSNEYDKKDFIKRLYQNSISVNFLVDVYYPQYHEVTERLASIYQYIDRMMNNEYNNDIDIKKTPAFVSYSNFYKLTYRKILSIIDKEPTLF